MDGRSVADENRCRGGSRAGLTAPAKDYQPRMPVELWFGEHHIGVRPGTPTCEAFQRFANALLDELKAAREAQPR